MESGYVTAMQQIFFLIGQIEYGSNNQSDLECIPRNMP
jgi:hypothetical protein